MKEGEFGLTISPSFSTKEDKARWALALNARYGLQSLAFAYQRLPASFKNEQTVTNPTLVPCFMVRTVSSGPFRKRMRQRDKIQQAPTIPSNAAVGVENTD